MRFFRALFEFYINGSIHVAFAVLAMVKISELEFEISASKPLEAYIFFGTITAYNFIKYAEVARFRHIELSFSLRFIQVFSLISVVVWGYFLLQIHNEVILWSAVLGILTVLYAVPIVRKKNLRSVAGFKILIVGLVWAGCTVLLPILEAGFHDDSRVIPVFIQRFLFVVVLTLPFEIRDLRLDLSTLGTLPQLMGVDQSKRFGYLVLILCLALEYLKRNTYDLQAVIFLLIAGITALALVRSQKKQSRYFASFWVEGIPILWYGLLLLIEA